MIKIQNQKIQALKKILLKNMTCYIVGPDTALGPIVQSTISANAGLNFNLLFWLMPFCSTVCFKTLKNKSSNDPEYICGKTCSTS